MFKFIITLLFFSFFSCKSKNVGSLKEINDSNIKSIFNKKRNLVFIWTTWCGASKDIIKDTYANIQKDTNDYNIILICGNLDEDNIDRIFSKNNINLKKYITGNATNYLPIMDRKNIKNFILENFTNTDSIDFKGNFSIPITLLVDSNLKILNYDMPQDSTNIRLFIDSYKN